MTQNKAKTTTYANTKYGYVARTSHNQYKNWCLVVTKSYDGYLLAEVSFHKAGNVKRRPTDAVYYEIGTVSDKPSEGLDEMKKKGEHPWSGWIVLPAL